MASLVFMNYGWYSLRLLAKALDNQHRAELQDANSLNIQGHFFGINIKIINIIVIMLLPCDNTIKESLDKCTQIKIIK